MTPQDHPSSLMGQERSSALRSRALLKSCVQETHKRLRRAQQELSEARVGGRVLYSSFLSPSHCVFHVTVCPESPTLLPAAIEADSTAKSNKYMCIPRGSCVLPGVSLPVQTLTWRCPACLGPSEWHSIAGPSSVTPVCVML